MRKRTAAAAGGPAAAIAISLLTMGCATTGWIRFEPVGAGLAAQKPSPAMIVQAIDCQDYQSADLPALFPNYRQKILYITTCAKDGGPIPWKVVGVYHAAAAALDKWEKYGREVADKGRADGCPALLVRQAPPPSSQQAQAIGALCVDPAQPSGINGPLRLASYTEKPLRVLADAEPDPPPP